MADINGPNVRIMVLVSEQTQFGRYDDALRFTFPEFNGLSDAQVATQASDRVAAWVQSVQDAQANPVVITTAQKIEARDALLAQVAILDADIADD